MEGEMNTFKVGDVVEVIDHPSLANHYHRKFIGLTTTVTALVTMRITECVQVDITHPYTGNLMIFGHEHLRLRRPPSEPQSEPATDYQRQELGDWGLCPWRPSKERV